MIKDEFFVYNRLVCEFSHWDVCTLGLLKIEGKYHVCRLLDEANALYRYEIYEVVWNEKCQEYLDDYFVAYKHWFHVNGTRPYNYNGWDLSWFSDKWQDENPIIEQIQKDTWIKW